MKPPESPDTHLYPRILVKDTENGKKIQDEISDLKMLLNSDAVN